MKSSTELLPKDIYALHLVTISGIKFTPREIDIIACLTHGKSVKGIANFLSTDEKSIGARSVETHINNLRRKISGSSKESIIEFIEDSDKYQAVRNYYSSLLLQKGFRKALKKIAEALQPSSNTPFLIISLQQSRNFKNNLGNILYDYFKIAGARVSKNIKYNIEDLSSFFSDNKIRQNLIFILPSECYVASERSIGLGESEIYIPKNNISNTLFLFYPDHSQEEKKYLTHFQRLIVTNPYKPYLLFFKTLKHFFPNSSAFDDIVGSFIAKYQDLETFPVETKGSQSVVICQVENKKPARNICGLYYIFIGILIVIIICNFFIHVY